MFPVVKRIVDWPRCSLIRHWCPLNRNWHPKISVLLTIWAGALKWWDIIDQIVASNYHWNPENIPPFPIPKERRSKKWQKSIPKPIIGSQNASKNKQTQNIARKQLSDFIQSVRFYLVAQRDFFRAKCFIMITCTVSKRLSEEGKFLLIANNSQTVSGKQTNSSRERRSPKFIKLLWQKTLFGPTTEIFCGQRNLS